MRLLLFVFAVIFSLFLTGAAFGAPKKAAAKVQTDTTKIALKKFDSAALKKYNKDAAFNYTGEATGQPSFWDRLWDWLTGRLFRWFDSIPYGGTNFKVPAFGIGGRPAGFYDI